jgi:hypothetical protein
MKDPFFRCRSRQAYSAHQPPESERLLPGIVFQQNWPKADILSNIRYWHFVDLVTVGIDDHH